MSCRSRPTRHCLHVALSSHASRRSVAGRRALIVEGAAGSDSTAADNLPLRDFGRPIVAPSIDAAITLIQREHIDLLVVPLADMQPLQLQALERVLRRSE